MNTMKFSEAMNEINDKYIDEAVRYQKKAGKRSPLKWGMIAACCCLLSAAVLSAAYLFKPPASGAPRSSCLLVLRLTDIGMPQAFDSDALQAWWSVGTVGTLIQDESGKQASQNIVTDETMTMEEARSSEPFGGYLLSEAPSGFSLETIRRYEDEKINYLSGLWTKGEGSFDEISWRVSFYDETMESRVTSVDDTRNYDLNLYPIPLADSVPEELFEVVDHPIFNIEELTLEAVSRRAYSIDEIGDTDGIRMSFGVRYGDIVVEVTTKGVSPEWIYERLVSIYQYKSCINFRE